ncbi:MAG: PH domain-containing protein [Sporichthyaceae bacterium]
METLALPHTWRPRRTRIFCYSIATFMLATLIVIAIILPDDGSRPWSFADRAALVLIGVAIAAFLHKHASVRVTADVDGLEVVNLFKRRRVVWGEVLAVRLRRGDPWAYLDLSDGETLAVMGIQASDGDKAPAAARAIATLVHERSQ